MKDIKCYGLEVISATNALTKASYKKLCEKFEVNPEDIKRPSKLDLFISMWDYELHPQKLKTLGHMTLYNGLLGKVFGGWWSGLEFPHPAPAPICTVTSKAVQSLALKAAVAQTKYGEGGQLGNTDRDDGG